MKLRDYHNVDIDINNPPKIVYSSDMKICIYKLHADADNWYPDWYLDCQLLKIDRLNLHTDNFREAIKKAKFELCCKLKSLDESISGFINTDFEVDVCPTEVLADHRDSEEVNK